MRLMTIALPLAIASPTLAFAQQSQRFTLSSDEVVVYNLVGAVTVEPGSGSVVVQVTRGGPDAARLTVQQDEMDGRQTLRVRYPEDRVVYGGLDRGSSTELRVREDGTFGDGDDHGDGRGWRNDGRRVRISGAGEGLEAHADLTVRLPAGKEAAIYLAVGKVSIANVDGRLHVDAHSAPVTATGTKGTLRIDVGSGPVQVSDAEGDVNVDTGSGSVEVSRFRGSSLSIDTGSGDVTGSELETAELSVDTGSGEIRLTGVGAPALSLETGSGGIAAELRRDVASLDVETGSGDIAIRAPASLGATVEIETSSGDIDTDFPLQVTRRGRDHVVGTIGDGKGTIEIQTGSGGIRLLKTQS